jgi:Domain of unknown function (DUF4157)
MRRYARRPPPPAPASAAAPARAGRDGVGTAALPAGLRAGIETLSGVSLADVPVHYDSAAPARIGAGAFAAGDEIHVAPGQERHLPHEAWHIVQQKQGRVRPTTALKRGGAASRDPALEAEADRMGAAAARAPSPPPGAALPAARAAPSPPAAVVQPNVIDRDTWLKTTDPVSPTLAEHIKSKKSYRLRDDFHGRLGDEPVHLLDMSKKYLIGEEHGAPATAKWKAETQNWSKVDKMFEWNKALPREDRKEVGLPGDTDLNDQALESRHAYLLANVFDAQDDCNVLGASFVKALWTDPAQKDFIRDLVSNAIDDLFTVDFSRTEYGGYVAAFDAKPRKSRRSRQIYDFGVKFRDVYHPAIGVLSGFLNDALAAFDRFHAAPADPRAADEKKTVESALDKVAANRAFLVTMANELIALNGIKDKSELAALAKLLKPADTIQGSEILNAVNPARERGMVENINSADAPLLVKLGDDHVDSLKAAIGAAIVPIHKAESLEKETRKPKAP